MSLDTALAFSLHWEGGATITEDPSDPGGLTKYGISKRAHPTVDIRNLTEADAKAIYQTDYWDKAGCGELGEPLDMLVFDAAVNVGVSRAVNWLLQSRNTALPEQTFMGLRETYYKALAQQKPAMAKYLKGWLNRCAALRKAANIP